MPKKSVKSDVDAFRFDGEALIGAADALNGDRNVVKADGEALNGVGKVWEGGKG